LEQADLKQHSSWVVGRVVELGNLEDVRLLARVVGRKAFMETVRGLRMTSRKVAVFWQSILKLEAVSCTRKHSRPQAVESWPP
jgi:hypothetical protein